MSGRVLRFEGPAHLEAERLLPWLINGTLQGEERRLVEQHLAECSQCQREVEWLKALQEACEKPASVPADTAQALQRMRRRIGAERAGLRTAVERGRTRGWGGRRNGWRWAVAAQAAVIFALACLLIHAEHRQVPAYRTLGAAEAPVAQLVVVFDPRISEAQLRSLVRASNARIVDGPTDAGAYVLNVPRARAATIREALRAAPGVNLVENLSGGGH